MANPGETPGYSMPGEQGEQLQFDFEGTPDAAQDVPSEQAQPSFRARFQNYVGNLNVGAGLNAWQEARPAPRSNFSPQVQAGLNAFDPTGRALGAAETAAWAFKGRRTTSTYSPYREQTVYGGVQRDAIPTSRISMRSPGGGQGAAQERMERQRNVLNEQELYPSPAEGGSSNAAGGAPQGLPPGTGFDPVTTSPMHMGGMMSDPRTQRFGMEDPLFAKNTGAMPFNQAQFGDLHQRSVAGGS
jgi:hypothetical protein